MIALKTAMAARVLLKHDAIAKGLEFDYCLRFFFVLKCCFTSTETIRDGEPRMATSIFTQLLSSEAQRFKFNVAFCPQTP